MSSTRKVALVTGAAHGIGRAVALQFAREGAAVLVSDRRTADVQGTADCLRSLGARVLVVSADVGRPGDIQHLVERCCAHFGRLDIACNLAGPGGVQGMQYQIEAMLLTGGGAVVNVAQAAPGHCPSDLRHEAQRQENHRRDARQLLRSSTLAHGARGVRINTVAPGLIARSRMPTLFSATATDQTGRVAELVAWLASDRAAYVSGAFYPVEAAEPVPA